MGSFANELSSVFFFCGVLHEPNCIPCQVDLNCLEVVASALRANHVIRMSSTDSELVSLALSHGPRPSPRKARKGASGRSSGSSTTPVCYLCLDPNAEKSYKGV